MSNIEHLKGKLIFQNKEGETLQQCIERILIQNGQDLTLMFACHKNLKEKFEDIFYGKYYIYGENIYKLDFSNFDNNGEDISVGQFSGNDIINVELKWYNGGASLNEMLDELFKQLKSGKLETGTIDNERVLSLKTCEHLAKKGLLKNIKTKYVYINVDDISGYEEKPVLRSSLPGDFYEYASTINTLTFGEIETFLNNFNL